jgi:hypothetical protein
MYLGEGKVMNHFARRYLAKCITCRAHNDLMVHCHLDPIAHLGMLNLTEQDVQKPSGRDSHMCPCQALALVTEPGEDKGLVAPDSLP